MRPLGRRRRRFQDKIKIYSKEVVITKRNWIDSDENGTIGEPL